MVFFMGFLFNHYRMGYPLMANNSGKLMVNGIYRRGFWLVVTGTMEFYDFPYIGNVIIPTDFHIFSEG